MYCSGWLKRGPSGIIGTNITDAKETVASIVKDLTAGSLKRIGKIGEGASTQGLLSLLKERQKDGRVVTWKGYQKINEAEEERGARVGKPREKIDDVDEMIEVSKTKAFF